ncbi:TraB/GumN family protein [Qipengyuania spongiae]|uniref:TraB/GumN family protein n=1 Tax=Qipengyuania spongiae TaxID=2909673 RepID=A0ABY5SW88_9SPHN|nr:TraB/GumN family protein [Qipengyuania spongiae]UVI38822.1 TraB/GumN family protein [Qipengyuania spongiae]
MKPINNRLTTTISAAALVFGLQGWSAASAQEVAPAPAAPAAEATTGPALWKVADEDTTIYLFGTVHALPEDTDWMRGPISEALASAETLVTEIEDAEMSDPAMQQKMMISGMLPEGTALRSLLNEEQTATYEAALAKVGVPAEAFDRFKPWMAGITLSVLPIMQAGYTQESGVEKRIEAEAGPDKMREALETVGSQLAVFETLPQEAQIAFLMSSAEMVDDIVPMMDQMVAEWLEGDADGLAELMNRGLTDPQLAEALLYKRNRNWVEWIESRMDAPGTVFMAVGAGHLAGKNSVQDYLEQEGVTVTRVQ